MIDLSMSYSKKVWPDFKGFWEFFYGLIRDKVFVFFELKHDTAGKLRKFDRKSINRFF